MECPICQIEIFINPLSPSPVTTCPSCGTELGGRSRGKVVAPTESYYDPSFDAGLPIPEQDLMTMRHFIKEMNLPIAGEVAKSFVKKLLSVLRKYTEDCHPFELGIYKTMCLRLLEYEYARVSDKIGVDSYRINVIVSIIGETKILKAQITEDTEISRDEKERQISVLRVVFQQAKYELANIRENILSYEYSSLFSTSEREDIAKLRLQDFAQEVARRFDKSTTPDFLPPHLKIDPDRWLQAQTAYTVLSSSSGLTAFANYIAKVAGGAAKVTSSFSTVTGAVSVALAPVAIFFDAKHFDDNKESVKYLDDLITKETKSILDLDKDDQLKMMEDALKTVTGGERNEDELKKYVDKWGGKVSWKEVTVYKRSVLTKRASIKAEKMRIFTTTVAGACAATAIVLSGGTAAIVITIAGVTASAIGMIGTVREEKRYIDEYKENWESAELIVEGARMLEPGSISFLDDRDIIKNKKLLSWLNFSDGFFYTQYKVMLDLCASR